MAFNLMPDEMLEVVIGKLTCMEAGRAAAAAHAWNRAVRAKLQQARVPIARHQVLDQSGTGMFCQPTSVAVGGGAVYVSNVGCDTHLQSVHPFEDGPLLRLMPPMEDLPTGIAWGLDILETEHSDVLFWCEYDAHGCVWKCDPVDGCPFMGDSLNSGPCLHYPMGLTVADNHVYVAEPFSNRVAKLHAGLLIRVGSVEHIGTLDPGLKSPRDVAAHGHELYICDSGNHRIVVVETTPPHAFLRIVQVPSWGPDDGSPLAVCTSHERLYATDTNNRLHVLSLRGEVLQTVQMPSGGEMNGVGAGDGQVYVTRGDNMEGGSIPTTPPGGEENVVVVFTVPCVM